MAAEDTSYHQALNWIYGFSNTERTGQFVRDREDNLARERALLAALGNPQRAYSITHIAGTKGKGSTSALLASILREAGVSTGLYTSPDLHTFRERIRLDGAVISEAEVARLVPELQRAVAQIPASLGSLITWEVATALAFLAFREARVRHAVVEVGLGGRLDATNVVEPMATCITSISYDHMEVLGDTLTAIATEKAGILKSGVPAVTSARAPEALATIARIAEERGVPLIRVGPNGSPDCQYTYTPGEATSALQTFSVRTPTRVYERLELTLLGEHQLENATAAVALADILTKHGIAIDEAALRRGLRNARWQARLQVVGRDPWRIVDGAHNADSFAALFRALRRHFRFERLVLVAGLLSDKDLPRMADEIARGGVDALITTEAHSPRALPADILAEAVALRAPHLPIEIVPESVEAIEAAERLTSPSDLLCVAGSLYLAGEALRVYATRSETIPGAIEIAGVDH